jgi:hypothetical protein
VRALPPWAKDYVCYKPFYEDVSAGPKAGGYQVVIYDDNLDTAATILFGSASASIDASSPDQLTVIAQANDIGLVKIRVTTPAIYLANRSTTQRI